MDNKTIQIRVGGRLTAVVGLESILADVAQWAKGKEEAEIMVELLRQVEARNYIPSKMNEIYGKALLREYKKYLGEAVEEEAVAGLQVVILGPGCAQCSSLELRLREVMTEMNLAGDLTHITDVNDIARYGVMGTPALIINGKVVAVGIVPEKKKIQAWLSDAVAKMA